MPDLSTPPEPGAPAPGGTLAEGAPQVVNLRGASIGSVQAELVRMHQSAAEEITCDEIEFHQSGAFDVVAVDVSAHEAALGVVNASQVDLTNSGVGVLHAENVDLGGTAGVVFAGSANLGNTYSGLVASREVRAERIDSLMLVARHVEGQVHTVVDARGAALAGILWGVVTGVVLLLGRLLFGRRS